MKDDSKFVSGDQETLSSEQETMDSSQDSQGNIQEESQDSQTELAPSSSQEIDYKSLYARALSDYENLVKRNDRERLEMSQYHQESILRKLLPSLDTLHRILSSTPEGEKQTALYQGIIGLEAGLKKYLEQYQVTAFDSLGKEVDVQFHEVISQGPGKAGEIIAEAEKGYLIGERVLRHAKVVVGMDME